MSDKKITQLTALTANTGDDLLIIVDDPAGTPETKKMEVSDFAAFNIRETAGPTVLSLGAVADGEFLKRSGSTITSAAAGSGSGDIKSDGSVAFAANQSMGSHKLTNVTDPTSAQDAATKNYVDAIGSGFDFKESVRVATTANVTLSGTQTIDGVSVIATNRVLVKNQSTGADNGIYVCAAGSWSRSTDADTSAEVTAGMLVAVEEGTTNADTFWLLTTNNAITLGTTALTFTQFGAGGGGGTTINTTDGAIPYRSNSTTFADSPLSRVDASTVLLAGSSSVLRGAGHLYLQSSNGSYSWIIRSDNGTLQGGTAIDTGGNINAAHIYAGGSNQLGWSGGPRLMQSAGAIQVWDSGISFGATLAFKEATPSTDNIDHNNWNFGTQSYFQRVSSTVAINITGVSVGQLSGEIFLLVNVGSGTITLKHEDTNSTAANRFLCSTGADIALSTNQAADLIYDSTSQRFRVFKKN